MLSACVCCQKRTNKQLKSVEIMNAFKVNKDIIVMGGEPSPDMTLEMAEIAAKECVTESGIPICNSRK